MTAPACETVSTREAAQRIGVGYEKALELIRTKRLRARWHGNKFRVPLTAIAEYLDGTDIA